MKTNPRGKNRLVQAVIFVCYIVICYWIFRLIFRGALFFSDFISELWIIPIAMFIAALRFYIFGSGISK